MRRIFFASAWLLAGAGVLANCAKAEAPGPDCGTQTLCGSICVDPQVDTENCGACGAICPNAQACVSGKCTTQCPGGEAICTTNGKTTCANTKSDNLNCGGCGKACKSNEACVNGTCSTSCSGTKKLCTPDGGTPICTDPTSDNANCGTCGKKCKSTESCIAGACTSSCNGDQTLCSGDGGGYCANLQTDNANCGSCGAPCGVLEACVGGACTSQCAPNQTMCTPDGGTAYCVDSLTDNANCGSCGNVCPKNKPVCSGGVCTDGAKISVMVCAASGYASDVPPKLMATNAFTKVDLVNCGSSTPTLLQMQAYQSLLVFSDSGFANSTALGDNLADYVAGGGYAVVAVFANASVPLAGKWISQNYNLVQASGQTQPTETLALNILDKSSPLVAGVTTLTATAAYRSTGGAVNGGVVVAQWGSGAPLIVRGVKNGRNRAELNFYPPSSTIRNDFWVGDGATILKNALVYR